MLLLLCSIILKITLFFDKTIVMRNGRIVWKVVWNDYFWRLTWVPKTLVPRIRRNSSNVNIEWAGIYLHFIILILMFLTDYACRELCNIWLVFFENNSRSYHHTGASHWRKSITTVVIRLLQLIRDRWQLEKAN